MVQGAEAAGQGQTPASDGDRRPTDPAPHRPAAPRTGGVLLTRVADREAQLQDQGFSDAVAARIARGNAPSTLRSYQYTWNNYIKYCRESGLDPTSPSVPQIADYLLHCFNQGLHPHTLENYKSVICKSILFSRSINLAKDADLHSLLTNLYREYAQHPREKKRWDLNIVLRALREPPYEPLQDIHLRELTWKTTFLLLLATGARRGEVHALDKASLRRSERWNWLSFCPTAGFISKTQVRTRGETKVERLVIKSLPSIAGPDLDADRFLCPVRCLKIYLARTQHLREGKKLLLISHRRNHSGDICKNTITGWIRKLIHQIYEHCSDANAELSSTTGHQIRGAAATLATKGGASLDDVLAACHWKGRSVFASSYLQPEIWTDAIGNEILELGPIVAAQHIVGVDNSNSPQPQPQGGPAKHCSGPAKPRERTR